VNNPLSLIGQWSKARAIVGSMEQKFKIASDQAVAQEAHFIRKEVVTGIREGAPGGQVFEPLSPITLAIRKGLGFSGTKPLLNRGDLRNGIVVKRAGGGYFVGVLRTAKTKTGKALVNVADLMENGGGPWVIPITAKSRRFFHAVLRRAGFQLAPKGNSGATGGGHAFVIVKIKARPFLRPVFEKHSNPADVRARFVKRMAPVFE
jgi:hypothetical protein